jgi:hypothetical protein
MRLFIYITYMCAVYVCRQRLDDGAVKQPLEQGLCYLSNVPKIEETGFPLKQGVNTVCVFCV